MSASVEKLKAARELIARPGGWCAAYRALDAAGKSVNPNSSGAVTFCAGGALERVGSGFGTPEANAVRAAAPRSYGFLSFFNNNSSQAEVVAAFDRAIALAEAEAS